MEKQMFSIKSVVLILAMFSLVGCESIYFSAMEKVGIHKRDIFKDRIEEARDAQQASKEQFVSALDEFKKVLQVEETSLEKRYTILQSEYDDSEAAAQDVRDKIDAVESVSEALFEEWEEELELYQSEALKRSSQTKLRATRRQYNQLMGAMKKVASKMDPVLATLRDQTLYLKHNLNAQSITAVKAELGSIEREVAHLVRVMEISISKADAFVKELE